MRIASWNVNGLRAIARKGFDAWLASIDADVVGVQEIRCTKEQAPALTGTWHLAPSERPGYSGVGLHSRLPISRIDTALGVRAFDREGRVQMARIGKLLVVNAYFPNGNGKDRDLSRVPFKLRFYRRLYRTLAPKMREEPIVVMGDFNTAPYAIDLARPKQNESHTGFLPEERKELRRWLDAGWVDTFRAFEPGPHRYTWWSQRIGVREKNIGWRLDLALASPAAAKHLRAAAIHPDVRGSDHCPISLELDDRVVE